MWSIRACFFDVYFRASAKVAGCGAIVKGTYSVYGKEFWFLLFADIASPCIFDLNILRHFGQFWQRGRVAWVIAVLFSKKIVVIERST